MTKHRRLLIEKLAMPLAKFLMKSWLGEPASIAAGGLLELAAKYFTDYADQREAQRQFESIAEKIIAQLEKLFDEDATADINVDAVTHELQRTYDALSLADVLIAKDLDPTAVTAATRSAYSLPASHYSAAEEHFYHRAIDAISRYLVETAHELPAFESKHARACLSRLSRLVLEIDKVLLTVQRIEARLGADGSEENRYEADYRQAVIRNLDYVELFGADFPLEARRHTLSVAYISLNLTTQPQSTSESVPAESVLRTLSPETGRLLIRGDAGSGKSTLSRWIAIRAAEGRPIDQMHVSSEVARWTVASTIAHGTTMPTLLTGFKSALSRIVKSDQQFVLQSGVDWKDLPHFRSLFQSKDPGSLLRAFNALRGDDTTDWCQRIPFLVRLRDCKKGSLPSPNELPSLVAKQLGDPPHQWVLRILREGRAILLLDGIDEVPNRDRDALRRELEQLVNQHPANYFLISTRPTAVPVAWLADLGFREAAVNPLSEAEKLTFIDNWHSAVAQELDRLGRPEDLSSLAEKLKEKLREEESAALSRLAVNPLLCASICALHRDRQARLPESQAEICEALTHLLLHRRETESGLDLSEFPSAYRSLSYPEKKTIVRELAYHLTINDESTVPEQTAQEKIVPVLTQLRGHSSDEAPFLLRSLVERSGLLREVRPGWIEFAHNTLKEYLAGEHFADDYDTGLLAKRVMDPAWQPVIFFAVATTKPGFATELIKKIIQPSSTTARSNRSNPDVLRARMLVALQCRSYALLLDEKVRNDINAWEKRLFPPKNMSEAAALALAGDSAVSFLKYSKRLNAREATASVRTLRLIGTQKARERLSQYFGDQRWSVVSELAQVAHPLNLEKVRIAITSEGSIPFGISNLITDLEPAASWKGVESLSLWHTKVNNLKPLSGLRNLKSLTIIDSPISDLAPIAGLTALSDFAIAGARITDFGPLSGLANLERLQIFDSPISDASPLSALKQLRRLTLAFTKVSDLAPIQVLQALQELEISGSPISDFSAIGSLLALERLSVNQTDFVDARVLGQLRNLQQLDLEDTKVENLEPLQQLTKLEFVDIGGTRIRTLEPLRTLTNLREIAIRGVEVADWSPLESLKSLKRIIVGKDDAKPPGVLGKLVYAPR